MTSERRLRAAILGCGRIAGAAAEPGAKATTHAQALAKSRHFVLAAVADEDADRARAFAARWHVGDVCTMDDLAGRGLDLLVIATPDGVHASSLAAMIADPRPPRLIVVEKPLCVSPDELLALEVALAAKPQATIVVNHSRRFDHCHRAARDLIATRRLGPVINVRWVYYGGWMHNGVHMVDALRMLLGGELEVVDARTGCEGRSGDPCLDAELRCRSWPHARILIEGHPESAFQLFEGEIRLRDGRVRLLDFGNRILVEDVHVNPIKERELGEPRPIEGTEKCTSMESLYDLAARFLMGGDREIVRCSGLAQAAATMRVMFDARRRIGMFAA